MPPDILYIDEYSALEDFCAHLMDTSIIGIDTEFLRERTYYPLFCLLQLSTTDCIACIDPLLLPSLEPLRGVLESPNIIKVFHSGRQDIELILQCMGVTPACVYDTQIAAALAGLPDQIGYARLIEHLFNIQLLKEHTRTDWSKRPLSREQLSYAYDDVLYLIPAHHNLIDRLTKLGRHSWFLEDSIQSLQRCLHSLDLKDAWRKVRGSREFSGHELQKLMSIALWRETSAQELNLPRAWVMSDEFVCQLARSDAKPQAADIYIRGLSKQQQSRHAESLLHQLDNIMPDPEYHATSAPPFWQDPNLKSLLKRLTASTQAKAEELGLSPTLLASRSDLEQLLQNPSDARVLKGWRYEMIGRSLEAQIAKA